VLGFANGLEAGSVAGAAAAIAFFGPGAALAVVVATAMAAVAANSLWIMSLPEGLGTVVDRLFNLVASFASLNISRW
jgi:phage tail sheath gpL-like